MEENGLLEPLYCENGPVSWKVGLWAELRAECVKSSINTVGAFCQVKCPNCASLTARGQTLGSVHSIAWGCLPEYEALTLVSIFVSYLSETGFALCVDENH